MPSPALHTVISATVTVAAILVLQRQCRKPAWWPGRAFLWIMNARHSDLTDWGLGMVPLEDHFTILDVGCGGGRTIQQLARIARAGKVVGIDYAPASVAVARRMNVEGIEAGQVDIREASVSHLPFPDRTFDVVTAVETHYYWPDPVADAREIARVLKPGGRLAIIAETYKGRRFDLLYRPAMALLRATYLSATQHADLLVAAGFTDVTVYEERRKGWLCVVGRRGA